MITSKDRIIKTIGQPKVHHVKLVSDKLYDVLTSSSSTSSSAWEEFTKLTSESERLEWLEKQTFVQDEIQNCIKKLQSLLKDEKLGILTAVKEPAGATMEQKKNDDEKVEPSSSASPNSNESDDWKFLKCEAIALQFKDNGNKLFGAGKNHEALEMYNEALLWIPNSSQEMGIIYANRSACLYHLEQTSLALADIQLSFEHNYPTHLKYKLYERAGRCYLLESKIDEAKSSIQTAIKCLEESTSNHSTLNNEVAAGGNTNNVKSAAVENTKLKLETLLISCKNSIKLKSSALQQQNTNGQNPALNIPKLSSGSGSYFGNASRKLKMIQTSSQGRFMIATAPIYPGDVLLVEKAFVSRITTEFYHRQCSQCFIQMRAPIPCTTCSFVSYCSIGCRDEAWSTHHQNECCLTGLLNEAGLSITSLMAVRILTNAGSYKEVLNWIEKPEFININNESNKSTTPVKESMYPANSIDSFLRLVSHSNQRRPEDWLQRCIMSLFLVSLLKLTPFCDCNNTSAKSSKPSKSQGKDTKQEKELQQQISVQDELILGKILLRILQILQFNAHEVAGWDPTEPKSYFLGGGVFPTLALFNHSCSPSIVRYFINDTVIVQAIRTIQPNEEVTENYGPLYTNLDYAKRQAHLRSQYWFDCHCIACEERWPLLDNLTSDTLKLRCSACHAPLNSSNEDDDSFELVLSCPTCNKPTNLLKTLKLIEASEEKYNNASELLGNGKLDEARIIFEQLLKFFDSALILPFRDYHLCQEGLRRCILPLGNQTIKYW